MPNKGEPKMRFRSWTFKRTYSVVVTVSAALYTVNRKGARSKLAGRNETLSRAAARGGLNHTTTTAHRAELVTRFDAHSGEALSTS
jgi:hypothetical protein